MSAQAIVLISSVGLVINGVGFLLSGRAAFVVSFGICAVGIVMGANGFAL